MLTGTSCTIWQDTAVMITLQSSKVLSSTQHRNYHYQYHMVSCNYAEKFIIDFFPYFYQNHTRCEIEAHKLKNVENYLSYGMIVGINYLKQKLARRGLCTYAFTKNSIIQFCAMVARSGFINDVVE